ncbi:MAG: TIGR03960 family B12-binding radical SAM protein, partial [Spirochaetaceae bacterium]|nr:TIGR03960 family B12-binding radical SAM protein [Spirochaetaceae bacterium]
MKTINPLHDIGFELNKVQNPVRYLGGEFGTVVKNDASFTFAVAFPDLYEIAMSNQAVRIIYNGLNRIPSVRCERVFTPAPDFEELLKRLELPLYTLESGIPLHKTDMIGFSIGYELGFNGVLSILETGGVPLLKKDRSGTDPIVIAGGCGVTNPAPYKDFFDAVFIGEAEPELFLLVEELSRMKQSGAGREAMLEYLGSHPAVWTENGVLCTTEKRVHRAVYTGFGADGLMNCFPISSIRSVQDHGVVEIMRGCPNGCRFCHAGIYYRPQRMKDFQTIINEAEYLVRKAGHREISLTSLSSGDYQGIGDLLDILTTRFSGDHVSFQLPSLKVNTFTLPLLEKLSEVRKSGLTFAIETPVEAWQLSLNKEVYRDRIIGIIQEAKKRGWSKAKFYFMVGLPVAQAGSGMKEEEEIVQFMLDVQNATRIQCSVNVGTFIPKPHTPYQWAAQLSPEEALGKMEFIRGELPRGRFKVSTHREFNSFLEGMLSRGDERVGGIILDAYRRGCRLDAWEDYMKPELWREAIASAGWDVQAEVTRERSRDEKLPWDGISLGPSKAFLRRELDRSIAQELSPNCEEVCSEPCGLCGDMVKPVILENNSQDVIKNIQLETEKVLKSIHDKKMSSITADIDGKPLLWRVIFSFSKNDGAEFLPHLGLVETLHKSFLRSGLPVVYTEGFNPLPRLELAASLSIGITSDEEIGSCLLESSMEPEAFIAAMEQALPGYVQVQKAFIFPATRQLKRESLASLLWGSEYRFSFRAGCELTWEETPEFLSFPQSYSVAGDVLTVTVPFGGDRKLRDG